MDREYYLKAFKRISEYFHKHGEIYVGATEDTRVLDEVIAATDATEEIPDRGEGEEELPEVPHSVRTNDDSAQADGAGVGAPLVGDPNDRQ